MDYESYVAVHLMQQEDLQRSEQAKEEARKVFENDILNDEEQETVEEERARTHENIARMQGFFGQHEASHRNITRAASEDDLERSAKRGLNGTYREAVPYPPEDVQLGRKGFFNPERLVNACTVANELVKRRVRQDRFQRRRRRCVAEEFSKNEALERSHEQADKRLVLRQHELLEKQAEKTSVAQQKRGEQQKHFKELQKFQDAQFEKLQLKHHPASVSTQKNVRKLPEESDEGNKASKASSPPPSRPSTSPAPSPEEKAIKITNEVVYRQAQQSRQLYRKTLENWDTFVTGNERRTDAYWHKMLEGPKPCRPPSKSQTSVQMRSEGSRVTSKCRNAVKEMCNVRKFLAKAHGSSDTLEDAGDDQKTRSRAGTDVPCIPEIADDSPPSPSFPSYAERLEKVRLYQSALEAQALEKRERNDILLEAKREKSREEQNKKARRANEHIVAWEQKSAASAMVRNQLGAKSDTELVNKLADQKREQAENEKRLQEERQAKTNLQSLHILNVKNTAANKAAISNYEAKLALSEKEERGFEKLRERFESYIVERGEKDYHKEKAMNMAAERRLNENAFSRATLKTIEQKQTRSEHVKSQVRKAKNSTEAMEKFRTQLQAKSNLGQRIPPPELTLVPGWEAPECSVELAAALSPRDATPMSCKSSHSHLVPGAAFMTDVTLHPLAIKRGTAFSEAESRASMESRPSREIGRGIDGTGCHSGRSADRKSVFSSLPDSDGSDLEEDFLAELHSRSTKWLDEIRQKEAV